MIKILVISYILMVSSGHATEPTTPTPVIDRPNSSHLFSLWMTNSFIDHGDTLSSEMSIRNEQGQLLYGGNFQTFARERLYSSSRVNDTQCAPESRDAFSLNNDELSLLPTLTRLLALEVQHYKDDACDLMPLVRRADQQGPEFPAAPPTFCSSTTARLRTVFTTSFQSILAENYQRIFAINPIPESEVRAHNLSIKVLEDLVSYSAYLNLQCEFLARLRSNNGAMEYDIRNLRLEFDSPRSYSPETAPTAQASTVN